MPRDGTETYVLPFPDVVDDTTIESPVYNGFTNDVAQDLNTPRPIKFGGTGANNADTALTNIGAEKANQTVTNYDSMVWMAGSFSSAGTATAAPVAAHAFTGIVYMADSSNIVVEARDIADGKLYIRRKVAGTWGAWVLDGDLSGVSADIALKVAKAGDTMTGPLVLPAAVPTLGTHATNKTYVDAADAALAVTDTALAATNTAQDTAINNRVRYDAAQGLSTTQQTQARANISAPLRSWLSGLTLSAAGSTATFGIAAGEAANSTNVALMQLASAYTKTTGAWAVGTGNGALDTGSISAAAWYHVYLIRRSDTGVVDVCVSSSATTPTFSGSLAAYDQFRRIGSMRTVASQWVAFSQSGDEFLWKAAVADANAATAPTGSRSLINVTVPTGVVVNALIRAGFNGTSSHQIAFTSPDENDQVVGTTGLLGDLVGGSTTAAITDGNINRRTNTAAQIGVLANSGQPYFLYTYGWIDRRGRDV